jgi:hypothetical protein
MKIKQISRENLYKCLNLNRDESIMYMGGRIDDDKLYPQEYTGYLNRKIKEINPSKIICHNHWYAKKYYELGILDENTKIDVIFACYWYVVDGNLQMINPSYYSDHRQWMKRLIDKNSNINYALYISEGQKPGEVTIDTKWFSKNYNLENIKYFTYDRTYTPKELTGLNLNHGEHRRNSSDGFGCLSGLIKSGYNNISIVGFSGFGSDEDMSYHSSYDCDGDPRFYGKKYFNLNTSEDLRAESDILKYWTETGKIKNIENHSRLIKSISK